MMTDQITPEHKARSPFGEGFWDRTGWGLGGPVVTRSDDVGANPGAYGWTEASALPSSSIPASG